MNIMIVGAGNIGSTLAEELSFERDNIVVIDKNETLCQRLNEKIDLLTIPGDATSPAILEVAGIRQADIVIALTQNDEVNILVCGLARHYGVSIRMARLHTSEFSIEGKGVDIAPLGVTHILRPDKSTVDNVIQYVETPGATDAANFQEGSLLMRGYTVTPSMSIAEKKIADIRKLAGQHLMLIVAIIRQGQAIIPSGKDVVHVGDKVLVLFPRSSLEPCLSMFNKSTGDVHKAIISGDTHIAVELASALARLVDNVILVDPDASHATLASEQLMLKNIEVLHGDCTQVDVLQEMDIHRADYFISVASDMENNVMSSLLAKAEGAARVVALTNQIRYIQLFHSIGISHVICPRISMAREIMEIIYRGRIWKSMRIRNVDIEAVRLIVPEKGRIVGKTVQTISKRHTRDFIIGLIIRNSEMIMPQGDTEFCAHDEVIIITSVSKVAVIRKIFE